MLWRTHRNNNLRRFINTNKQTKTQTNKNETNTTRAATNEEHVDRLKQKFAVTELEAEKNENKSWNKLNVAKSNRILAKN